ncbi:MAG: DUF6883 domain-containing protein [Cyanobacteria bacterium J06626_4]
MIYLSANAIIAEEKLTRYLLVQLSKDDKSKFLASAGYTLANWCRLEQDLRNQVLTQPAEFLEKTQFGDKYAIRTALTGPNGTELIVLTIWIVTDNMTKFVTLVPNTGGRS